MKSYARKQEPNLNMAKLHLQVESALYKSLEQTIAEGVEQTAGYMDRCGTEAGHLIIFDRRENRSWDDKVFHECRKAASGVEIEVWGM